ncbi:hypothetical protein SARC_05060 [Sphaeroforma arctica JP610]|uniref:Uncharacterized protein n=1 Tax=Sphaeroforma arctica JP610 TaxID=667725 RepID=A0A0L0G0S3_9EUKA|nr:hypothetical protein SARC_05060 [Sphaeroforma arctica JP610]KNC82660.1 hypothetical protein SARC_05060 [Sphaeroforma arctica JP610]|eukprot:XP_014156562.1 hypothetical protein SARC_05060 [Sphaeroforma arctica JP610]
MGRAGGETHHRASLGVYNRTGSGLSISSNSSFAEQLSRQTDQAAGVAMHDVIHGRTDPVTDSHQHAN